VQVDAQADARGRDDHARLSRVAARLFFSGTTFLGNRYVCSIGATLFVALYPHTIPARAGLIIVLVAVQSLALLWYMLSYIPFARDFVKNCCKGCCADATGL